jgi:hypothetical protein
LPAEVVLGTGVLGVLVLVLDFGVLLGGLVLVLGFGVVEGGGGAFLFAARRFKLSD